MITAKKPVTKPVGLSLGASIGAYTRDGVEGSRPARTRCFFAQKASISPTRGNTAKFQDGGGEAVPIPAYGRSMGRRHVPQLLAVANGHRELYDDKRCRRG